MHEHDSRVIAALRRLGAPATASTISHAARLPLHITLAALDRLIADGLVIRVLPGWGRVLYRIKQGET